MNEQEREMLRKLFSLGLSCSSVAVAELLGSCTTLHLHSLKVVTISELQLVINERIRLSSSQLLCASHHFFGTLEGEALCLIDPYSVQSIAKSLGAERSKNLDPGDLLAPVMELGSLVSASCLREVSDLLGIPLSFTRPSVKFLSVNRVDFSKTDPHSEEEHKVILLNIELAFTEERTRGSLYFMMDRVSFKQLISAASAFFDLPTRPQ